MGASRFERKFQGTARHARATVESGPETGPGDDVSDRRQGASRKPWALPSRGRFLAGKAASKQQVRARPP
jgi:hypothetical protein